MASSFAEIAPPRRRPLLPYAQLLRVPNVFTAFADIALGVLVTGAWATHPAGALLLALASGCLYCGGMVWNDWFDRAIDARERPSRPLPSGRVAPQTVVRLGVGLLVVGMAFAALAGTTAVSWSAVPLLFAGLVALAVLIYDSWLKRTSAGPVSMAACRFLNVLLGLSLAGDDTPWSLRLHLAAIVGLYIVGVTWFARKEAETSRSSALRGASAVMLLALVLALPLPLYRPPGTASVLFPYLLVGLGFVLGRPLLRAIRNPGPAEVQAAVKTAVLGLVALDAVLATALAGTAGLLVLLLLPPALWLGKWVYTT